MRPMIVMSEMLNATRMLIKVNIILNIDMAFVFTS